MCQLGQSLSDHASLIGFGLGVSFVGLFFVGYMRGYRAALNAYAKGSK